MRGGSIWGGGVKYKYKYKCKRLAVLQRRTVENFQGMYPYIGRIARSSLRQLSFLVLSVISMHNTV